MGSQRVTISMGRENQMRPRIKVTYIMLLRDTEKLALHHTYFLIQLKMSTPHQSWLSGKFFPVKPAFLVVTFSSFLDAATMFLVISS